MTSAPRSPHGASRWRATCALLAHASLEGTGAVHVAGGPMPRLYELEEALLRRGVDIVRCRGIHDAMAEALLHERKRRTGEAKDPFIIVFVEPELMPEAPALVNAAATHAPHAVFWQYTKDPSPRLTAWTPTPVAANAVAESAAPEPKPRPARPAVNDAPIAPMMLRLAGQDEDDDQASIGPGSASLSDTAEVRVHAPAASELTEDELAMLLAPEEEEMPPRQRG